MSDTREFSFGDNSVANAYDEVLAPALFEPWADRLIDEHGPWAGRRVLDLATGTGVVAERLARHVGPNGKVFAADINGEMLAIAMKRCAGIAPAVEFVECPAHPLDIDSDSMDFVVCQQGFQFFPDKCAAAQEMYRVLKDGGQSVATTWCPVVQCQFFGAICDALGDVGEREIADMMRVPFNVMPVPELTANFEEAGFADVQVCQLEQDFVLDGGPAHAIDVAYATPIGPTLRAMPEERQAVFCAALTERLSEISSDGKTMGQMVSNLVSASKRV